MYLRLPIGLDLSSAEVCWSLPRVHCKSMKTRYQQLPPANAPPRRSANAQWYLDIFPPYNCNRDTRQTKFALDNDYTVEVRRG